MTESKDVDNGLNLNDKKDLNSYFYEKKEL